MRLEDFDYELPRERIAQDPLPARDASRLMVLPLEQGPIVHDRFRNLQSHLRRGDLVVLNDTRVVPARIPLRRQSGGRVDALILGALAGNGSVDAFLHSRARLREGEELIPLGRPGPRISLSERKERGRWIIELVGGDLSELLSRGRAPLPPYICRDKVKDERDGADLERYQTVFATRPGAVAAPTAGLHFSEDVLDSLHRIGIEIARVTLHVGPGTFLPVRTSSIENHHMMPESYEIRDETLQAVRSARERGGRIIAVGTTVCRALEAAADGVLSGWTDLFVRPGYRFRVIDGLLTNFHMPRSTLLMLVSALVGRERLLDAYREAVREEYRFFSYGDAMLILPERPESRTEGPP